MAFEIDFNASAADQKVELLINRLEKMSQAATKASASLIPSDKAIQAIKKVSEAHTEISKSLDKVVKVSESATKKMKSDMDDTKNGVKQFFNALDKSITSNSHKVNAWRGTYGQATQEMVKANQELKKEANELARAQELANNARFAQAKQTNAQIVADDKASINKRTRDWTEYYKKQEAQINRYSAFLKSSQSTWTTAAADKRQRLAGQIWKIAQQETKFEQEAAKERTRVWSDYYRRQDEQIARYNKSLNQSRVIVEKSVAAQKKRAQALAEADAAQKRNSTSMMQSNQITASFRASMAALGTSFGIYTSGTFAVAAGTYAVVSAMQSAVTTGAEFEKSMYRVYAVTGQMGTTFEKDGNLYVSTSEKIKRSQDDLSRAAVDASKVTVFTAVQAAEGLVALGMAGLDAQQSIGALTPSLQLAQIGMIDVYESADIMTNVMLGFGMSIEGSANSLENATMVTDVLAAAITNSNSTIKEMSKALSYVAPIAHAAGGNIQGVVAALETFHNVGIKGQRAGTSLRRAYVNLLEPTDKVASKLREMEVSVRDSEGAMRGLTDIMLDLEKAGATTADLVTIFGVRAAPAMVAFMDNLQDIVRETNRLQTSVDGAAKSMADFMATSTSGQWQIIQSKIQAQFVEAFQKAEPAVKKLNIALFELVDKDLDSTFDAMGEGLKTAAEWAEALVGHVSKYIEFMTMIKDVSPQGMAFTEYNPAVKAYNYFTDQGSYAQPAGAAGLPDVMMPKVNVPRMPASNKSGWENMNFKEVLNTVKEVNEEINIGVLKTQDQIAEDIRREESSKRLIGFARLENEILSANSMLSESTSAKREMAIASETIKYQEKLGLITQEQALTQQLASVDAARVRINEKYVNETAKVQQNLTATRDTISGTAADSKEYAELLRQQAKLNDQLISQTEQLNQEAGKLTLTMQEAAMKEQGFGKLTKQVDKFATKLQVANEKLSGNKQATEENTIVQFKNAVARREVYQSSSAFLMLSTLQQEAFIKETQAIQAQIPALDSLVAKNKELTDAKAAKIKADKAQKKVDKLVGQFGKGKGLGDEGKGMMAYTTELDQFKEYQENKAAIMQEYGMSELEFQNMMVEAKLDSEQRYWDSQHEHLAKWRDEWSSAIADNVEKALFMEQSWSETGKNIARTMLGTVVNSMIKIGAEMLANHLMKMAFSSSEIAMDTAVTANKVSGEAAKTAAATTTAAAEATANTGALAYFTEMLGMGPALAAAWGPAAMYISIASFGSAGVAGAAAMALAGAATAAAGVVAGAGGAIGESVAGARQFGGPVKAGNSYMVGEAGREVFTPDTNGYITSNQDVMNSVGGRGDVYITYDNKYYIDATGNEELEDRLNIAIEDAAERGHQKVLQDLAANGDIAKMTKKVART